jgi:hypothetical protein
MKNNKIKASPVSWLQSEIDNKDMGEIPMWIYEFIDHAIEIESQKQQKYDEVLEILEKHLIFHNAEMEGLQQPSSEMWFELYGQTEQLIKEAKEL